MEREKDKKVDFMDLKGKLINKLIVRRYKITKCQIIYLY